MGMPEYNDGEIGLPKQFPDAYEELKSNKLKSLHVGGIDELSKLKNKLDGLTSKELEEYDAEAKQKQLDRIEGMLASIIIHQNIPHKGIVQIKP